MKDRSFTLADGRNLGYIEYGEPTGIPILLLHGTPGSRIFGFEKEPLVEAAHLRLITPERPGYGVSTLHSGRTLMSFARDLAQLADALALTRFHVAGISGGGPYALACGAVLGDRVGSVSLIASATPVDMEGFYQGMSFGNRLIFRLSKTAPFIVKLLYRLATREVLKRPEKVIAGIEAQLCEWDKRVLNHLRNNGQVEVFIAHLQEAYRQGIEGAYSDTMLLSQPWGIDYQRISAPVFMWHGQADTLMPIAPAQAFSRMLPQCESEFIADAGHFLLEDEEIAKRILSKVLRTGV